LITPFTIAVLKLCKHGYQVTELVDFMVPFATGMGASVVWRFVDRDSACHVPTWILAVLIDALPGAQLVFAAYEFQFSSIIYITSRLVRALFQCMLLAIGTVAGWQVFGHNLAVDLAGGKTGAIASLPPSQECGDNLYKRSHWMLYFGVFNVPLLFVILLGTNLRVRDTFVPLLISYVSLFVFGWLSYAETVAMPAVVNNIITVSLAAHLGSLHEYFTGVPPLICVLPVIFFLAPGSPTFLCVLQAIHNAEGDAMKGMDLWSDLVMQGLSYAVGLHLATAIWRPVNFRRARTLARQAQGRAEQRQNAAASSELRQDAGGPRDMGATLL